MVAVYMTEPEYLRVMADGTVKQQNPYTGTTAWTVPGRGNRPLGIAPATVTDLKPEDFTNSCAFCPDRYFDNPPEKSRMIRSGDSFVQINDVPAEDLFNTEAEFRRVPNLFEIVSYQYWNSNYGYTIPQCREEHQANYAASEVGIGHLKSVVTMKLKASGWTDEQINDLTEADFIERATDFFATGHDLIIARRHYRDDAKTTADLASSGTLTPEEHEAYIRLTVSAARDLYEKNRYARYVSVFQNWLKPAGASFDHLHKQLVTVDEWGLNNESTILRARQLPNIFNYAGPNYACRHNLILAENDYAIAFAGFGHRYPGAEVYCKSSNTYPWELADEELRGMSDLMHAMHAATGADVPMNEEWHTQPIDVEVPMPWRVVFKWRISNPAGFEGGTRIYVNTVSPMGVRDRMLPKLEELRESGQIAPMKIGRECKTRANPLRYLDR